MNKETQYQLDAAQFIERQTEAYSGSAVKIYTEEFETRYISILQECSPMIGGRMGEPLYEEMKKNFAIVGLREKIFEFNETDITAFINKYKRVESVDEIVDMMFEDFRLKYLSAESEAELHQLIFATNDSVKGKLKKEIYLKGVKELLSYRVIYHEDASKYLYKNNFYTIRERVIPVNHSHKKSERPDFVHYINGIPLVIVEYKTEDSGLLASLKDFTYKESYKRAPFKVALNDGRDAIFFSDIRYLKYNEGKDNSFHWVYYSDDKKYLGQREYTNAEYLFEELLCQPERMYSYCTDCCTVASQGGRDYLINARIQQYYAIKDVKKVLVSCNAEPFNYLFSQTQRSGKTITMKLASYMIKNSFENLYNTVFIYTPDLQIKDVIHKEFSKSGNGQVVVKIVNSRREYQSIIEELHKEEQNNTQRNKFCVYIVNMQQITDKDLQEKTKVLLSTKILNILDEAHHGQSKESARIRQETFLNASNFLFTATGKSEMYQAYFPGNTKKGYVSTFTMSNAIACKIVVPVLFLKAEKHFNFSDKIETFTKEVQARLKSNYQTEAELFDTSVDGIKEYLNASTDKSARIIAKDLKKGTIPIKIDAIIHFINTNSENLSFKPKAIIYADSVEEAQNYIAYIQTINASNTIGQYRFGIDYADLNKNCEKYNPGMTTQSEVAAQFEKDGGLIDILIAVDKYQKGFDLPKLVYTFLDTKIMEPSRLNQIYTRTATKQNGKTVGYCVDLTLGDTNINTFKESLALYDSQDRADDFFIDDAAIEALKETLTDEFVKLKKSLCLNNSSFTAQLIHQQIFNEPNHSIRQQRQASFFNISRNIFRNLNKMRSPMFYKPFHLELKALYEAFTQFKKIYADKNHADHAKILINTDKSLSGGQFISDAEIRSVIEEVLLFIQENNLTNVIQVSYTNNHAEIHLGDADKCEIIEKFKKEAKKDALQKNFEQLEQYLSNNHKDLYDAIKRLLLSIGENGELLYTSTVQAEIVRIEAEILAARAEIQEVIKNKFNGNKFLFWAHDSLTDLFASYGVTYEPLVDYITKSMDDVMKTILPQINQGQSVFEKTEESTEMFIVKSAVNNFTFYLPAFIKIMPNIVELTQQLRSVPKINGESALMNKDVFIKYLKETMRKYYQNI